MLPGGDTGLARPTGTAAADRAAGNAGGSRECSQRLPEVEFITFWVSHERPGVPVLVSVGDASRAKPDEALDLDFQVGRDDIQVQAVLDCLRLRHASKQPRGVGVAFDRTPSCPVP